MGKEIAGTNKNQIMSLQKSIISSPKSRVYWYSADPVQCDKKYTRTHFKTGQTAAAATTATASIESSCGHFLAGKSPKLSFAPHLTSVVRKMDTW